MAVRKPQVDPAHEETERLLAQMEKRIQKEYAKAEKEVQATLDDYLQRFALKDQKWQEWVKDGKKTKAQYQQWRIGQIAVGKRWDNMKQTIAEDYYHADQIAKSIIKGYMPEVYATNFNYGTYEAEVGAHVDTSFNLYSRESVERLMRDDPTMLPAPGKKVSKDIAEGKAVRWTKQQLQSVMTQSILQGDSIPKMAERLAKEVGDSDMKASIRNARTMATGAQNAGRVDAYKRAQDKGIKMVQMWRATLDNRTRHSHRQLDGEKQLVGEPFSNGCEFPGDPHGAPSEIYNCRCTLRGVVAGLEPQAIKHRDTSAIGNISYDKWKAQKRSESNPITLQKEKGEAIAESYRNEYRDGLKGSEESLNNYKKTDIRISNFEQTEEFKQASQDYAYRMEKEDIDKFNKIFDEAEYVESSDESYYNVNDGKIYINQEKAQPATLFHESTHWYDFNQKYNIVEYDERYEYLTDANGDFTGKRTLIKSPRVIKENAGFSEYIAHEWEYYSTGDENTKFRLDMANFVDKLGISGDFDPKRNPQSVIEDYHAINNYIKNKGISITDPDYGHLSDFLSAITYDANMGSQFTGGHTYDYWTEGTTNQVLEITAGYNLLRATERNDLIDIEKELAPNLMAMIEKEWAKIW